MLKSIHTRTPGIRIRDAVFPVPFPSELEYSCPARGTWNIVHTGFLIPEAHEIFVCAAGCLRGVVLTAAECNACERFSTIEIREHNVLEGDMEALIVDGVTDILEHLPYRPKAVLLYTSCIHHFMGCDLPDVYRQLQKRFPDMDFTDCYMNPIMRKSGLTPDQLMRRQLYSLLKPVEQQKKQVNLIGNNIPVDQHCELYTLAERAGVSVMEIMDCKNYSDYQKMSCAYGAVTIQPAAIAAGDTLQERLGQTHLYLPSSFSYAEIADTLQQYAAFLGLGMQDFSSAIAECEAALEALSSAIGKTPVVIDYTAVLRPLGLAKLLLEHGIRVQAVYADSFVKEEYADFVWLQQHVPDLKLFPTVNPVMRVQPRESAETVIAIGQKAAYFTGTPYFVNIVEGGGLYGFTGIIALAEQITASAKVPKDTKQLIQIKGLGCGCV